MVVKMIRRVWNHETSHGIRSVRSDRRIGDGVLFFLCLEMTCSLF